MNQLLNPIMVVFAWIWVGIHDILTFLGLPDGPGFAWVLSIILLTIFIRILIIPLYLKQIKSMRNMQIIQPELQKLQGKYKGKKDQVSRQAQSEEMMALYKKHGASPFASCLPMIVQLPVLFGLYRVIFAVEQIKDGTYDVANLGPLNKTVATDIDASTVFGVGLSQSLGTTPDMVQKAVFVLFIAVMVGFQFLTMRLSMKKNMAPQTDPNNPMVRSQKMMMYMMPAMFIFTGLIFKMALLVYMVTTTLFGWLQQVWVIKVMPTPGSPAYADLLDKREAQYKEWASPMFKEYDADRQALGKDQAKVEVLQGETLSVCETKGKKQRIPTDFPEGWSAAERLDVYRNLAVQPWKAVPDEAWLKQMVLAKEATQSVAEARKPRPKKLSKEQRKRLAERERMEEEAQRKRDERLARREAERARSGKGKLTDEEIERRRQQRRAERRRQNRGEPN